MSFTTKFNPQTNKFEAECPRCLNWTSDGQWLEVYGYCTECDDNQDFWMDKMALGRLA